MIVFDELRKKHKPPEILFHYTDLAGLFGILSNESLWASKIHYLNDSSEFTHAYDLFKEYLFSKLNDDLKNRQLIHNISAQLASTINMNVFVCSLTENSDLLSQWRAYGGNSAGFSIGFNTAELFKIAENEGFYLCKCEYNKKEQKKIIENYGNSIIDDLKSNDDLEYWGERIAEFIRIAPLIKNENFKEEAEWRLLSTPKMYRSNKIEFRKSQTTFIPYYNIPINLKVAISKIIIGPNSNELLCKNSLSGFLIKKGIKKVNLISSKIPLRKL